MVASLFKRHLNVQCSESLNTVIWILYSYLLSFARDSYVNKLSCICCLGTFPFRSSEWVLLHSSVIPLCLPTDQAMMVLALSTQGCATQMRFALEDLINYCFGVLISLCFKWAGHLRTGRWGWMDVPLPSVDAAAYIHSQWICSETALPFLRRCLRGDAGDLRSAYTYSHTPG